MEASNDEQNRRKVMKNGRKRAALMLQSDYLMRGLCYGNTTDFLKEHAAARYMKRKPRETKVVGLDIYFSVLQSDLLTVKFRGWRRTAFDSFIER